MAGQCMQCNISATQFPYSLCSVRVLAVNIRVQATGALACVLILGKSHLQTCACLASKMSVAVQIEVYRATADYKMISIEG